MCVMSISQTTGYVLNEYRDKKKKIKKREIKRGMGVS